ncbi:MAG: PadR family transcriptional regulator [Bacteroides sp.]|nr:PadR family transcriptional regulator [Bacteroides sp.]MCM1548766.1 PadR family transcriptional regulator [Clostridium sp.]
MDIQLKRGMLDVCVLSALLREDSYGYKIIKDLQPYVEISESTLYPILRRLEGTGALSVYSAEHNGRLRKYYAITQSGRERIQEFLEEWKAMLSIYDYIKGEMNRDE